MVDPATAANGSVERRSRSRLRLDPTLEPRRGPEGGSKVYCTRCGHPNKDEARYCANCGAPLHEDTTVSLTPVEVEDEAPDEFPFPHDELEPGQALLLVKHGPNAGSTFLIDEDVTTAGPEPGERRLPRRHHASAASTPRSGGNPTASTSTTSGA